jgi:drug/metabolite transporter (DMT)-like permease
VKLAAGLLLAIVSACALNWGFFVQHGVAATLPPLSLRRPLHSLRALFTSGRWLLGYAVGIGGWGLYIAALSLAPLSIVQAASGGGIGVLALLVFRARHETPSRRETIGVTTAIAGLVLLGVSLVHHPSTPRAVPALGVGLWIAVSLAVVIVLVVAGRRSGAAGPALGAAAGILYASGDIATKGAFASTHRLEFVVALLVCHGLGFVALQRGFQLGGALQTAGLSTMLTNSVPIAAGIAVFHEGMPRGVLGAVRALAFALVLFAAVVLARAPAPQHDLSSEQPARAMG